MRGLVTINRPIAGTVGGECRTANENGGRKPVEEQGHSVVPVTFTRIPVEVDPGMSRQGKFFCGINRVPKSILTKNW